MDAGVSGYPTAARSSGGRKSKGETPTGGGGIGYTLSRPSSRQVREMVRRCCSCPRHSTCSTTVLSARACECPNAGRQCTGCYFWGRCKNRGRLMPSPTTARGLLGCFPRGADPPSNYQCASPPSIRFPTTSSLWVILAAGSGGWGARGGTCRRSIPRDRGDGGGVTGGRNRDGVG